MSVFVTPVAAGRENDRGRRSVPPQKVRDLDAEVRVIGGQPVIIAETRRGYVNIPVDLPEVISSDGQTVLLQRQGNGVVVPTEDGPVVVPLEDFDVVMVDGQLALVAEVNLLLIVAVIGATAVGGFTGITAGAAAATVFTTKASIIKGTAIVGGILGAAGAGAATYAGLTRR